MTYLPLEFSECQNCHKINYGYAVGDIADLEERVAPGEPLPACECHECGGLCMALDTTQDFPYRYLKSLRDVLNAHDACCLDNQEDARLLLVALMEWWQESLGDLKYHLTNY